MQRLIPMRTTPTLDVHARFEAGVEAFDHGRWHEAHEAFEDLWRAGRGPERRTWKGLAQACAALVHQDRGNVHGTVTLAGRALARLTGPAPAGVDLGALRLRLELVAGGALAGTRHDPRPFPRAP